MSENEAALLERIKHLRSELIEAERKLHDLRCEAAGVKAGDIVIGKGGAVGRVRRVETWPQGKAWVHVNRRKKDGTWMQNLSWWGPRWEHASADVVATD